METEQISNFLSSLSGSIDAGNIDLYKEIIKTSEIKQFGDYESFYFAVIYPFENFINGFIKSEISTNHDVAFLMKNSQFIERNFQSLIEQKDGFACSADKSRTIMSCLINFYKTGDEITFNYDAEYTYHLPKEIFKTHEHIVLFYEGLKSLFSGQSEKHVKALAMVLEV